MSSQWWFDDSLGPQAQAAFASLDSCFEAAGERITTSTISEVQRLQLDGKNYYLKLYFEAGERVSKYLGKSKARREWENLSAFKSWGLSAAKIVARGEQSIGIARRRGALITEGVEDSIDLAELAKQSSPLFREPEWVSSVIDQVAEATRVMHSHQFAHNDLKWRNILVSTREGSPLVTLIDCPAGRYWHWPFFEYRRIKDLACLDKVAKYTLTESQRMSFIRRYWQLSDSESLSESQRRDIAKITSFFSGRE